MNIKRFLMLIAVALFLASCDTPEQQPSLLVSLVVDGVERTYSYDFPVTVEQFLADAEVEMGELDRPSVPLYTQITNGMRVTIVRVSETTECGDPIDLPYEIQRIPDERLEAGSEFFGSRGQNGQQQVCYRVRTEDGVRLDPQEISRTTITEPRPEIIYFGPSQQLDPVVVNGTLAYISNGNAWIMRGSSSTKHPLTSTSNLDQHVFSVSPDGRQLIFTTAVSTENGLDNQLWYISDTSLDVLTALQLLPTNILYADWMPGVDNTISYSTAEPSITLPGWRANNNLLTMRIDPNTGETLDFDEVVEDSVRGLFAWWGTRFQWSPDGTKVACAQADGVGILDTETNECVLLVTYAPYGTDTFSWRTTLSWSPDSTLLLATVHGAPVGNEPANTSPAFHVSVTNASGEFNADIVQNAGIWSSPRYSPLITAPDSQYPTGSLAYLRARDWGNSINILAEYDLVVADRDGSNARAIFPPQGQPGMTANTYAQDFVWSPDGTQIALIYQGNLWVVDVATGIGHQLTVDGAASKPVWTR
jgi:resuscitation-promoting factor RpfB